MSIQRMFDLLETNDIPGTREELEILSIRVQELTSINGETWVRSNREKLLYQWTLALKMGIGS